MLIYVGRFSTLYRYPFTSIEYRSCDVIKKLFLEFLNFFFIFRKNIKNNVQMSKNQLNMLSIGWDMTIWINILPIGTQCYMLWLLMPEHITLSSHTCRTYISFRWSYLSQYLTYSIGFRHLDIIFWLFFRNMKKKIEKILKNSFLMTSHFTHSIQIYLYTVLSRFWLKLWARGDSNDHF